MGLCAYGHPYRYSGTQSETADATSLTDYRELPLILLVAEMGENGCLAGMGEVGATAVQLQW